MSGGRTSGDPLDRGRRREYGERSRSVVLVLLAPVFLVMLPALFVGLGAALDQQMAWPRCQPRPPT